MNPPNRKSLRLQTYDYRLPGAYFITLCTHNRQHLFQAEVGHGLCAVPCEQNAPQDVPYIGGGNPQIVGHGLCAVPHIANTIIHKWIKETERKFSISVDKYIIMPDHIHLLILVEERHAGRSLQEGHETERHAGRSLPDIMRWFKTMTTNEYIRAVKTGTLPPFQQKLWQKSYYDHIVRSDEDYAQAWQYIENNPAQRLIDIENRRKKKANPNL